MKKKNSWDWIFQQRKDAEKLFKPKMFYNKEDDILNIFWFPHLDYDCSIETESNIIFDITKSGQIKGIEIHGFMEKLKEDEKKLKKKRANFVIHMLKELNEGNIHQNVIKSIEDSDIILGIVCDEVENVY